MASAEEVQSLKREVEMLRQMLEQERRGGGSGEVSARAAPPNRGQQQQQDPYFGPSKALEDEYRREPTPRRPMTAATSPARRKALRWKDAGSPLPQQQAATYTQFVPIDTKRGKWWLKDRQILSRNVPAPNDQTVAMKVRETWLWSGRTIIVDKIVTGPRPRDYEYDESHNDREQNDHRARDLQDEAARYREELRRVSSARSIPTSPTIPLSSTTIAAQVAFHDSKQLAKEFIQPKNESNATVEEVSNAMRTASQRMEAQMAQAAVSEESQPDASILPGAIASKGTSESDKTTLPQLSPSKSAVDHNLPAL